MRCSQRLMAGSLVGLVMVLSACASVPEEETAGSGGATLKIVDGVAHITLEEDAAERLGIESTPIRTVDKGGTGTTLVMPEGALLYEPTGEPFVYRRTDDLKFEHARIKVGRSVGDQVFLLNGPDAGTEVVTQGGSLLWGVETQIDA
jgi:multidrug efflux pump subunit AcrA (membrane-fusion protein)